MRHRNGSSGPDSAGSNPEDRSRRLWEATRCAWTTNGRPCRLTGTRSDGTAFEFKTPLSSLRGAIELLQDHWDTMPLEKRAKFLENIAGDTSRLDRLVGRLMELAHAEVAQSTVESAEPWPLLKALQAKFEWRYGAQFTMLSSLTISEAKDNGAH